MVNCLLENREYRRILRIKENRHILAFTQGGNYFVCRAQGSKTSLPLINDTEDETASELSGGLEEKSPFEEKDMNFDEINSLEGTELYIIILLAVQ